ncbi:unnamed protein product [Ranitomeya imitator]|uniref:Reverse transcriptase domain-containing protein n=1 Tax=Ranitomeya imitator TaxID=111125 RepID=A0ABN9M6Q1_9NEOB|nr:unnamed protein product [Ranitomeya imitator]
MSTNGKQRTSEEEMKQGSRVELECKAILCLLRRVRDKGSGRAETLYRIKAITETKQNIQNIEAQLSATLSSTEWSSFKTKTDKALAEHQKVLQERKRLKFQRDSDDYANNRVYKWTDSSTSTWRRSRYPHRDGSHSSESDSSTTSNRRRFLNKGRRGGHHEGDPRGEESERMTTRSQQWLGLFPLHSNLSSSEKQALSSLHTNKSIVIKPADKGGAIVVMNRTQYMGEINRQLSDTNTYGIIPRDPVASISRKIQNVVDTYLAQHTIDQKTATFLVNPHPVTPVFYVLPKVHKSLHNPPGRPIVASTDSILSPLSVFLEKILTPLIKSTRSFLLDTGHFLRIIRQLDTVPPNSTLVTLDVNSLYTSIQHTKGIEATEYLLCQSSLSDDTIQLCLDLLTLVLYENYFLAEDTFYIQRCGTAMGSNVAPAYANAFMNHFEISHVFTNDLFIQHVLCYHRYIDDIFLVWTGNPDTLLAFHSHLNSILPELQFTIHHSMDSVPFLDTLVLKDRNGGLSTDIYNKPTDCNSLLHYTSCHPRSLKNSLPRSQFNRVARIVSDPETLNDRLNSMAHKFQARCYPSKLLTEERARTLSPPSPRPPSNAQERVPFVHEFHPLVPKIQFIIRRHWPLLAKAYPNVPTFKEPVLMCNKRPPNIKDKLRVRDKALVEPKRCIA